MNKVNLKYSTFGNDNLVLKMQKIYTYNRKLDNEVNINNSL